MTLDRTTVAGLAAIGVAILTPVASVLQNDPKYAIWGLILAAAINGVGNLLSRDNRKSDQQAGARVQDPTTGQFTDVTSKP